MNDGMLICSRYADSRSFNGATRLHNDMISCSTLFVLFPEQPESSSRCLATPAVPFVLNNIAHFSCKTSGMYCFSGKTRALRFTADFGNELFLPSHLFIHPAGSIPRHLRRIRIENILASGSFRVVRSRA